MTIDTYVFDPKTGKATILKDPDANLDYTFDWTAWCTDALDSILSALSFEFAGADGTHLTIVSTGVDATNKKVVVQLSGGIAGNTYQVSCRITTVGPPTRIDERSIFVKIKDR